MPVMEDPLPPPPPPPPISSSSRRHRHGPSLASDPTNPTISALLNDSPPGNTPRRGPTTNPCLTSKFRGLGCSASAAARQVSLPEAIRTSAEWDRRKDKDRVEMVGGRKKGRAVVVKGRKKKGGFMRRGSGGDESVVLIAGCGSGQACGVVEDAAWCGMGVEVAGDVDFVVPGCGGGGSGRIRIDGDTTRIGHRERPSLRRLNVNSDNLFLDFDPGYAPAPSLLDVYGSSLRHYRHVRHPSPEVLAEAMMLKGSLMITEERIRVSDRFHGWRLDVDNMSYEQLLELGDRIGYVSTGLKEDEIRGCVRKAKVPSLTEFPRISSVKPDRNCSICQEEYEEEDEIGKLACGHGYHLSCIKQWLSQKNTCPVCKSEAVTRPKNHP
ncbi:hypothetical protein MLD38_029676 [Melastoma candidum]|uniref:Uncharacterized protein n=1 Tax=Melastoma candidum TaxID=119954 RepID=A0ACB9N6Y3_9MYRT|nr:hypothetical protein MLD38_029676 [Melastoma candidum]